MRELVVVVLLLSLAGCDSQATEDTPETEVLVDLTPGNVWVYQVDWMTGPVSGQRTDTSTVVRDSVVSEERWSFVKTTRRAYTPMPTGWYTNRADGTYWVGDASGFGEAELWLPLLTPRRPMAQIGKWQTYELVADGPYRLLNDARVLSRQIVRTTERLPDHDELPLVEPMVDTLYFQMGQGALEFNATVVARGGPFGDRYETVGFIRHKIQSFHPGWRTGSSGSTRRFAGAESG